METFTFGSILKILGDFGVVGLVIFLWWMDNRRIWLVLDQYKSDMIEQREMYKSNVKLVQTTQEIAEELKEIIVLNIQQMTEMNGAIKQNQFCPMARVNKVKTMQLIRGQEDEH